MNEETAGHRGISRRVFLAAAGLGAVAMGKENTAGAAEKRSQALTRPILDLCGVRLGKPYPTGRFGSGSWDTAIVGLEPGSAFKTIPMSKWLRSAICFPIAAQTWRNPVVVSRPIPRWRKWSRTIQSRPSSSRPILPAMPDMPCSA